MAIKTALAIVTALAIGTNMAGNIVGVSIINTQPKGSVRLPVKKDGSTCGLLKWSDKSVGID